MAKVIVDKDVLSSVPSNLDSVEDDLLESARKQLQKAQDILLTNKKVKNNITSVKKIDNLLAKTNDVSESVTATRSYTANMVSLIEKYEAENKMTDKEMVKFADSLKGNATATGAITAESIESSPWYSKMWNGIKNFTSSIWDFVKDVGATIATIFNSLIKGLAKLVEDVVDCVAYVGGAVVTSGAWLGDLVFGTNTHEDIWNAVNGFVAKDWVGGAWDSFYQKNPIGKWLCDHSWLDPQGTAANLIAGAGEVIGIIAITAACPPAATAMIGTSSFGASTELSAQNGGSLGATVLKGGVNALVNMALINGVGGRVGAKLSSIGGRVTSKFSSLTAKVAGSKGAMLLKNTGGKIASKTRNLVGRIGSSGIGRALAKVGGKISSGTKSLATRISTSKVGQLGGKVSSKVTSTVNRVRGISYKESAIAKDGSRAFKINYINGTEKDIAYHQGMKFTREIAKDGTVSAWKTKPMSTAEKIFYKSAANPGATALSTELKSVGAKISKGKMARLAAAGAGYGLAMDKSEIPSNINSDDKTNIQKGVPNDFVGSSPSEESPKHNPSDSPFKKKNQNDDQKKHKSNSTSKNSNKKNPTSSGNPGSSSKSNSGSSSKTKYGSGSSPKHEKSSSTEESKQKKTGGGLATKKPKDSIVPDNPENLDVNEPTPDDENMDDVTTEVVEPVEPTIDPSEDDIPSEDNLPVEDNSSNDAVATPVETPEETPQPERKPEPTYQSSTPTSTVNSDDYPVESISDSDVEEELGVLDDEGIGIFEDEDVDIPEDDISTEPAKKVTKTLDVDDDETTGSKHSGNIAIPIGLGLAGAGAAAVAGARYLKNRKSSEEYDEDYNDENNQLDYESENSESEYMDDNYLGPSGSSYTDTTGLEDLEDVTSDDFVPDDNSYTDASELEGDDDNLEDDIVFNELNTN